jgi:integrase
MRREAAKEQLARGVDPGEAKKERKRAAEIACANKFETVAREWFGARSPSWVSTYSERLLRRLEADVFPVIGARPVSEIEAGELLTVVRAVEQRGAIELAKRLLQVIGQVFRFAIATGRARRDPTQDLRGALRSPAPTKHRAALKPNELAGFVRALAGYRGAESTALGLKLVLHTFVRSAEARFAKWDEFQDLDGTIPLWRIPAERMKARSEHVVPLTPRVLDLLRRIRELGRGSNLLFPSPAQRGVISENTWIYAVYRLGYHSRVTIHGLRGTASTILNEHGFNRDWIERQLAHTDRNGVRAAYNSAEWLDGRRTMMLWWSDFLERLAPSHPISEPERDCAQAAGVKALEVANEVAELRA